MTRTTDLAIEASGLVKTFGGNPAVAGVDLTVQSGGVYGFLGPNGAGKTTTIRLVVTPDLLFLDEPTTGLDPRSRNQVWDIVRVLVAEGTTVMLTTQYLDEADQLADRIAVIDQGRVIAEGSPGQLKASVGAGTLHLRVLDAARRTDARRLLAEILGTTVHADSDDAALSARIDDPALAAAGLSALSRAGIDVTTYALGQPSLDEVFLALTGHHAEINDYQETPA